MIKSDYITFNNKPMSYAFSRVLQEQGALHDMLTYDKRKHYMILKSKTKVNNTHSGSVWGYEPMNKVIF